MRFTWIVEDQPVTGDWDDYVRNWTSGHYGGIYLSNCVWYVNADFSLSQARVDANFLRRDSNDYLDYKLTLTIGPRQFVAYPRLDGRA